MTHETDIALTGPPITMDPSLNGADGDEAPVVSTTDLTNYLRDVVPLVLGGSEGELSSVLSEADSINKLARWVRPCV